MIGNLRGGAGATRPLSAATFSMGFATLFCTAAFAIGSSVGSGNAVGGTVTVGPLPTVTVTATVTAAPAEPPAPFLLSVPEPEPSFSPTAEPVP